jgi:hypothetical protein
MLGRPTVAHNLRRGFAVGSPIGSSSSFRDAPPVMRRDSGVGFMRRLGGSFLPR